MSLAEGRFVRSLPIAVLLLAVAIATPAAAVEPGFGVHAGIWTDDSEPLVGLDLVLPLHEPRWSLNPSVEYVPGDHVDRWILNGDALFDLGIAAAADGWVGAGLAVLLLDRDRGGSDTEIGLNLLAGVGIDTTSGLYPYAQVKAVISDESSLAAVLGVRF